MLSVEGKFVRGDTVSITDKSGKEIARGLVAYKTEDANRIIGYKSSEIEPILGYGGREELVHRSDLVMS